MNRIADTAAFVRRLRRSGRTDVSIISIVLTEMHFRSQFHRFLEFALWKILFLLRVKRAGKISLGLAQVQARYWPRPPRFCDISCHLTAYDLVASRFAELCAVDLSLRQKIALHVGEVRYCYWAIAKQHHSTLT